MHKKWHALCVIKEINSADSNDDNFGRENNLHCSQVLRLLPNQLWRLTQSHL